MATIIRESGFAPGSDARQSALANQLRELIQINVAAGRDGNHFTGSGPAGAGGGNCTGGSALHNDAISLCHEFHGFSRRIQSNHERAIQKPASEFEHTGKYGLAADAIYERRLVFDRARLASRE